MASIPGKKSAEYANIYLCAKPVFKSSLCPDILITLHSEFIHLLFPQAVKNLKMGQPDGYVHLYQFMTQ